VGLKDCGRMSSGGVIGILVDLRFMLLRRERRGERVEVRREGWYRQSSIGFD
jgi:hypothetical protein